MIELEELTTQNSQLRAALSERENRLAPLEELTTQIAQMRAALSERESNCELRVQQLRAEVSERVNESEQLRGRIHSIQASICWRLTGPIWLHRQVIRAEKERIQNPEFRNSEWRAPRGAQRTQPKLSAINTAQTPSRLTNLPDLPWIDRLGPSP